MVRYGKLKDIFGSRRNRPFDIHLARLSVLYEDLRIELQGMIARSLPRLDVLDPRWEHPEDPKLTGRYRRYYFLRRTIATLNEFSECFNRIRRCPEFDEARKDPEVATILDDAIRFFTTHKPTIQRIRNDIGGHFGNEAAHYAIENLDPSGTSKIECILNAKGMPVDPRLHFAGDIAAAALGRSLGANNLPKKVEDLIQNKLVNAYAHVTAVVQALVATDLMWRFGRS
jgi:hypothetical protein